MLSLFLFLLAFRWVNPLLFEWPFYSRGNGNTFFNVNIGTAGQSVSLRLTMEDRPCPGISVMNTLVDSNGFNPDKSETYVDKKNVSDSNNNTRITIRRGLDDLSIMSSDNINQLIQLATICSDDSEEPFLNVFNTKHTCSTNSLSLTKKNGVEGNGFVDEILCQEKDKVVVFSFKNIPATMIDGFKGKITFGKADDSCSKKWHNLSESRNQYNPNLQWQFILDRVKVGNVEAIRPGAGFLWVDTPTFHFSPETYDLLTKEIGVKGSNSAPCNATRDIVYNMGNFELRLAPNYYLDRSNKRGDGFCLFLGNKHPNSRTFTLPVTLLKNRCLLLDFENKVIGVSDAINLAVGFHSSTLFVFLVIVSLPVLHSL